MQTQYHVVRNDINNWILLFDSRPSLVPSFLITMWLIIYMHPSAHPQTIGKILHKHCAPRYSWEKKMEKNRKQAQSPRYRQSSGAAHWKLLIISTGYLCDSSCLVARHHYGAKECLLNIFGGFSPQQTHHILHYRCITGQCDPLATCEPKLLTWYLQ